MLQALGDPLSLLLLLVGFLLAVVVQGTSTAVLASRLGDTRPRAERRLTPDPRRHVDPFGAVAGLIAGIGWAKPFDPPDRRRRGALIAVLVTGPLLNIVLGLGLLVSFRIASGTSGALPSRGYVSLLQFGVGGPLQLRALLLVGLSLLDELPWWVTVVVMAREVGVTLLRLFVIRHGVMPASRGGKLKTLLQALAIGLYLLPLTGLAASTRAPVMAVAVLVTVLTGLDYVVRAVRLRRTSERADMKRRRRAERA